MTQVLFMICSFGGGNCLPYLKVATQCWGFEIDNVSEKHIRLIKIKVTMGCKIFFFFENVKSCTYKAEFPFLKLKQLNLKNCRSLNSFVKWKNSKIWNKQQRHRFFLHEVQLWRCIFEYQSVISSISRYVLDELFFY